jgi:hypothetical protein
MLHVIQNAARHRYDPALFVTLGCQPCELTHLQLLQRLLDYVAARQLAHYDLTGSGRAWLDVTDTGLRTLLGLQDSAGTYTMWDAGQRLAGWREIVEAVHERWVVRPAINEQQQQPVLVYQQD